MERLSRIPGLKSLHLGGVSSRPQHSLLESHAQTSPSEWRHPPLNTIAGVDTTGRGCSVSTSESRQCCAVPPAIRAGLIGNDVSAATFELDLFRIHGEVTSYGLNIGQCEVPALEQKGFSGCFRQRVGEAVAEVQSCRVVVFSESPPSPARGLCLVSGDRGQLDSRFF